ncbi:SPOR domain-containing protein [Rhodoplanes sp. Z2-YC6860]|uniref:SPOR domain-containing protein n=1 Tax=Rhodoplanes sp. Z2-YC6860 TaxID=674703 RepID=UPI00078DA992|nr:SPOR domain-containing protein [Rhodoplanes sp. Z2-YC6860]AMN41985.1 hypothetical protein RHPLAN_35530 [Rhodoplanes sp. Z2-YC6860]
MSLVVAVYAGSTNAGVDRARYAAQQFREMVAPTGAQAARPLDANEGRRLADTVRLLSADRERLLARIEALEHNVDDMTGSITRVERSVRIAAAPVEQLQPFAPPTSPPVAMTAPQTVAPAKPPMPQVSAPPPRPQVAAAPPPAAAGRPVEEFTSTLSGPDATSLEPVPPASSEPNTTSVTKRQFGLDLGGSTSEEAARASWSTAVRRHGNLLQGLQPIVVPRDRPRGGTEYRLVAGPIADASKAARFCAAITSMGGVCQPAMYDGARVAGR